MAPPKQDHRVHSIFRSKTNLTQDSIEESESVRDRNAVASVLPTPVKTRSTSTRSPPSPSKTRIGSTVRSRRFKEAPCLAIDTTPAKENDNVVLSNPRLLVKEKSAWNRDAAFVEQSGWIPTKIRELGTGRVALLQPLTADELAECQSRRTRKKQNKSETMNVNDWLGKVIATQKNKPFSPAISALTTDYDDNSKIWPLRMFGRRRKEE
jgi:hypothetical protein